MTANRIQGIGEIEEGDVLQVVDREGKRYSLKYEGEFGPKARFKQMGRNTTRVVECDSDAADMFLRATYKRIERVIKDKRYGK